MNTQIVLALLVLVSGCRLARLGEPGDGKGSSPRESDVIANDGPAAYHWTLRYPTAVALPQAKQGCYESVGYFYRLPTLDEIKRDRGTLLRAVQGKGMTKVWTATRFSDDPKDAGYPRLKVYDLESGDVGAVLEVNPGPATNAAVCLCSRANAAKNCHADGKLPELGAVFPK